MTSDDGTTVYRQSNVEMIGDSLWLPLRELLEVTGHPLLDARVTGGGAPGQSGLIAGIHSTEGICGVWVRFFVGRIDNSRLLSTVSIDLWRHTAELVYDRKGRLSHCPIHH